MGGTPKVHVLSTDLVTVNGSSLLGNGNLKILNGKSAYELYVAGLGEGVTPLTEAEWILSLKGDLSPINAAIENINDSLENKVEKVNGKGLSTNDFTDTLKVKLDGIEANAEVNPIIVNNLISTDTDKTLAANQGYVLKGYIDNLNTAINNINEILTSDDTTLDELQEIVNYIKTNKTVLETLAITNIAGLETALNNLTNNKLDKSGGVISGPIIGVKEKAQVLVASTLDLNEGNLFTKTVTSNTTFTLTNISAIPNVVQSFILEITNGGNFIVTWWNNVKWDNGEMPELTENGVDILGFYTSDNGNTWRGVLLSKDSK